LIYVVDVEVRDFFEPGGSEILLKLFNKHFQKSNNNLVISMVMKLGHVVVKSEKNKGIIFELSNKLVK
jgi:hypothetical protein